MPMTMNSHPGTTKSKRSFIFRLLAILLLFGLLIVVRVLHFVFEGDDGSSNGDVNGGGSGNRQRYNNNNNDDRLQDLIEEEYRREFPFTMRPSAACGSGLDDSKALLDIAKVAIDDWEGNGGWDQNHSLPDYYYYSHASNRTTTTDHISVEMQRAEATWKSVMEACHGPLHQELESGGYTTLREFTLGLARCAHPETHKWGGHKLLGGMWCSGGFQKYANRAFRSRFEWKDVRDFLDDPRKDFLDAKVDALVKTARCALKFEFPFARISQQQQQQHSTIHNSSVNGNLTKSDSILLTNRQRNPNWKPQRVIILSPAMGRKGGPHMACRLVSTAIPRGWEVALIEGKFRGLRHKYSDAMNALKLVLSSKPDDLITKPEDTLVVFADSLDMLVQRSPESVIQAYLDMDAPFLFSAEPSCFPMAFWPHSLGNAQQRCEGSFPVTEKGHYKMGNKYANTGGWIGTASAAIVVLEELSTLVEEEGQDKRCHDHGTDQLLGNAAYLRQPTLIGLDYNYAIFASDAWNLIGKGDPLQLGSSPGSDLDNNNVVYRHVSKTKSEEDDKEKVLSPPLLHFNGGGSSGGMLDEGHAVLISDASLKNCRKGGKLTIVRVDEKKVWSDDFFGDGRWSSCSAGNFCAKS